MSGGEEPSDPREADAVEDILAVVRRRRGLDASGFARPSIGRRLRRRAVEEGLDGVTALRDLLFLSDDQELLDRVASDLPVRATTMFRDSTFFLALRTSVLPALAERGYLRMWVAGCSTGEEAWSLSILLREAGLLGRTRVYATDVHDASLRTARAGNAPLAVMREYTANYHASGGLEPFSDYYRAGARGAVFDASLRDRIVFGRHDLARDPPFQGFDLVLCRHVFLHLLPPARDRAFGALDASCLEGGFVGLGQHERPEGRAGIRYEEPFPGVPLFRKSGDALS